MTERRDQFEYEDLLACARGELFGPGNAQLPLPPMLMFDRISEVKEEGGEHGHGRIVAELDVKPDLGSSPAISKAIRSCPAALASTRCGSCSASSLAGWALRDGAVLLASAR